MEAKVEGEYFTRTISVGNSLLYKKNEFSEKMLIKIYNSLVKRGISKTSAYRGITLTWPLQATSQRFVALQCRSVRLVLHRKIF